MASLNMGDDDDGRQPSSTTNIAHQFDSRSSFLRTPVILNHLFQLCPPDILASSRLVCSQWRDISLPSWRKSAPLTFHQNNQTKQISLGKAETPLNVFWEYYYNPENKCRAIPFRSVKFKAFQFDPNNEEIKIFWRVFRNDLRTLKFESCTFPKVDEFRRILFSYFPNMRKLSLRYCKALNPASFEELEVAPESSYVEPEEGQQPNLLFLEVYDYQPLPITMLELLSHFQSLRGIAFMASTYHSTYRLGNVTNLLNAIKIIREHDNTKLDLQRFNIINSLIISGDPSTHEKFHLIQELDLPLERLHIHSDQVEGFAAQVLKHHSRTLREIIVESEARQGPSYWNFPERVSLDKLESLQMLGGVLCPNMRFLWRMPNLKKLVLRSHHRRPEARSMALSMGLLQISSLKLPMLTELEMDYEISLANIKCWISIMPNIEALFMPLNDEQFGVVCRRWRKLGSIGVFGDGLTDRGVTGESYSSEDDLYQLQMDNPHGAGNEEPPNITLLEGLERFHGYVPRLTDASIYNEFLKLPKLRELNLDIRTGQFGADARAALQHRRRVAGLHYELNGG